MKYSMLITLSIFLILLLSTTISTANYVLDSKDSTTLLRTHENGKLYLTKAVAPDGLTFEQKVLHLWGKDYYSQGYAHGRLLSDDIHQTVFKNFPTWVQLAGSKSMSNGALPIDIQKILTNSTGPDQVKAIFVAMDWVYQHQLNYTKAQKVDFDTEVRGIADGYCDQRLIDEPTVPCDKSSAYYSIAAINLFPELVRMGCTITASWGEANGGLIPNNKATDTIQTRLLDFGVSPFILLQLLIVRHFDNFTDRNGSVEFASQGFPSLVGVVTSVSRTLSQSQKVYLDFVDRDDDGDHRAPDMIQHVNKYLPPEEISGTKLDILIANVRSVPIEERRRLITTAKAFEININEQNQWLTHKLIALNSPTWYNIIYENKNVSINDKIHLWKSQLSQQAIQLTSQRALSASSMLQGYRPGKYEGLSDVFSIRLLIEKSNSLSECLTIAQSIERTWPIFLGFGTSIHSEPAIIDGVKVPAVIMTFEPNLKFWRDETLPVSVTGKTVLNNVLWVDRRPQPSPDTDYFNLLKDNWGKYTIDFYLQNAAQKMQSGDFHATWYDWNTKTYYVSLGVLDVKTWDYAPMGKAFQRPWMKYNWDELFNLKL